MKDPLTLLDENLATRRALGAGLVRAERLLRSFLAFLAEHEAARMTTQLGRPAAAACTGRNATRLQRGRRENDG